MIVTDSQPPLAPLTTHEVRVVGLNSDEDWAAQPLDRVLSAEERGRADRFATGELRSRFVARRGALRLILEGFTQTPADRLRIDAGPGGKPFLVDPDLPIDFNLSHSGPLAAVAVALNRRVGVDIERIRPMPDAASVVKRFFGLEERAQFAALPEDQQLSSFFAAWTRKEAFAKATGLGMAATLQHAAVTIDARLEPRLLSVGVDAGAPSDWRMLDLPTVGDVAAAVVAEGQDWTLSLRRWP